MNAVGCLALSLLIIFGAEKLELTFIFKFILLVFFFIYFLISLYINRNLFNNVRKIFLRYIYLILLCLIMSIAFSFIAFVIMVNFDLAIGGHL